MKNGQKIAVIVVAGGKGERASTDGGAPKQYRKLRGEAVLSRTLRTFLSLPEIDLVLPVIRAEDSELYAAMSLSHQKLLDPVFGGATRQLSVLAGLDALETLSPDLVLIHDAARPFVPGEVVVGIIDILSEAEAVLPVTTVVDTIKRSVDGRTVGGTEDRTQLYAAQTPQGFRYSTILAAHRKAAAFSDSFTDDAAIAEWAHVPVALSRGSSDNIKITQPADFARAEQFLDGAMPMETRVGSGFDIHAFEPGEAVILGGVRIPHSAKLKGHSDADAGLHVLTDALLGALAEGDIGQHFPPGDPEWKGKDSSHFLRFAANRVRAREGRIVHLDLTIIAERPKIGPHTEAMRERIAEIAGLAKSRVSVKATTSEKMGFVGREEGLATIGTATIELPRSAE